MKNKIEQIEDIKSKDWDNFKSLKEFVEAEKLSKQLQNKINAFHESFLISKSHTIEELATMPNINWLYVEKYLKYKTYTDCWFWDGEYKISLVPFVIRTPFRGNKYNSHYSANDTEKAFYEFINTSVKFIKSYRDRDDKPILKNLEDAENLCQKYNNLFRDKILEFVLYQKQGEQRFILNNKNNPIAIHTNGCQFNIDEEKNQLIVETSSSSNVKKLRINGNGEEGIGSRFCANDIMLFWYIVFDISTNNLLTIEDKKL